MDEDCQVLAHPHLFPTEKFDYVLNTAVSLGTSKNFNQRILNYTQVFALDKDYILFFTMLQHLHINNSISIEAFLANDDAINFINALKGTPVY